MNSHIKQALRRVLETHLKSSGFSSFLTWDHHSSMWVFTPSMLTTTGDWQAHLLKAASQVIAHANEPALFTQPPD
jgi:hypothetical protein